MRTSLRHACRTTRLALPLLLIGSFCCHASGVPRRGELRTIGRQTPANRSAGARQVDQASEVLGAIDTSVSRVFVLVGKTGLGHDHGIEGRIREGRLQLGAKQDAGSVVFDMTTFVADTATARRFVGLDGTSSESTRRQVTANMLGPAVLDVGRFPTAQFQIDSAQPIDQLSRRGKPQVVLGGQFTLHGVSRPLRMTAEVIETSNGTRVRGGFVIRQTDYGIKPFTKAFGAVGVADRLTIWGDLRIARGPVAGSVRPPATPGRDR